MVDRENVCLTSQATRHVFKSRCGVYVHEIEFHRSIIKQISLRTLWNLKLNFEKLKTAFLTLV